MGVIVIKGTDADGGIRADRTSSPSDIGTEVSSRADASPQPSAADGLDGRGPDLQHLDGQALELRQPDAVNERDARVPTRLPDGAWVGAGGAVHAAGTPVGFVSPVLPNNGKEPTEDLIFVNGILTNGESFVSNLQALANSALGARVTGLYNASEGMFRDYGQVFADLHSPKSNPTLRSLAFALHSALREERPLHLVGHSQGASIIARALELVRNHMVNQEGHRPAEVERGLGNIRVETMGGVGSDYIDGPQYVHYVNTLDYVSAPLGAGFGVRSLNPLDQSGGGAVVHTFARARVPSLERYPESSKDTVAEKVGRVIDSSTHGPEAIYFPERVTFEEARRGQEWSFWRTIVNALMSLVYFPINLIVQVFEWVLALVRNDATMDVPEVVVPMEILT